LKIRPSPENIPDPNQSDAGTTESEAQGVHIVHTLFISQIDAPSSGEWQPSGGENPSAVQLL
jgi:hypothetical protein